MKAKDSTGTTVALTGDGELGSITSSQLYSRTNNISYYTFQLPGLSVDTRHPAGYALWLSYKLGEVWC